MVEADRGTDKPEGKNRETTQNIVAAAHNESLNTRQKAKQKENKAKTIGEGREELQELADNAYDELISAESVFPFVLFPDTIVVSRLKVAITRRSFFRVSEVISLQIEDILNIESDVGPLFGSLKIYTRIYGSTPLEIKYLSRRKTIDIKHILEGYIIARQKKIDCSKISKEELVPLLFQLGGEKASEV